MEVSAGHLIHRGAVPLPLKGKDKNALIKGSAFFHCGNASLAGFWKMRLNIERTFVLPLEGKGDRSAVDEVICGPAPLREAL